MKKILFAINTLGTGGAEKAMIALLNRLVKENVEIDLKVILNQGELIAEIPSGVNLVDRNFDNTAVSGSRGKRHLIKNTIKISMCRLAFIRTIPYLLENIFLMLKEKRFTKDKLLWHTLAMGTQRNNKVYDLAIAFTEGAATYYVSKYVKAGAKASFVHVAYEAAGYHIGLDRGCYSNITKIFCVSNEVRENFLKVYPDMADKAEVFDNIIDIDRIEVLSLEKTGFSDKFDGYRILTVGRLSRQKNIDKAVRVLELLKEKGLKVRWYVLGDGEKRRELERLIKAHGLEADFVLMGVKANPYPFVRECDLFVNVSLFEGKSIAIQEAQFLEKAVVAIGCPGNREQICDKEDGLLCGESCEEVCMAIEKMIEDRELRTLMGLRAGEKIRQQCNRDDDQKEVRKLLSLAQ